jgi:hydroxylamine reductase
MFCYQCQETSHNIACSLRGVCGKNPRVAALQDYLLYTLKGLSAVGLRARAAGVADDANDWFVAQALFATLTNVNFDTQRIYELACAAVRQRDELRVRLAAAGLRLGDLPEAATGAIAGDLRRASAPGSRSRRTPTGRAAPTYTRCASC